MSQKRPSPFIIIKTQTTLKRFFTGQEQVETINYLTEGTELITIEEAELLKSSFPIKKLKSVELYSTRKVFLTPILKTEFETCLQDKLSELANPKLKLTKPKSQKNNKKLSKKLIKKLQVINLLENGWKNYEEIGERFHISRQEVLSIANRLENKNKGLPTKFKRPKKLSKEHLEFIDEYVQDPAHLGHSLNQIKEAFVNHFNLGPDFVSTVTINKALWHLKFSYKKIYPISQEKNSPRVKHLRYFSVCYLLRAMQNNYNIIYVDEVGFNQNMIKNYGFSKRKKQIKMITPPKSDNYSVIAALNVEGFLGFQIFRGAVKSEDFCCFLLSLVKKLELDENENNICFLMDNASIHKSCVFKDKILSRFNIIYNGPYSPELNPIEESFAKWKHLVRQKKTINEKTLIHNIVSTAPLISPQDARSYIRHSLKFFEQSFNKIDL